MGRRARSDLNDIPWLTREEVSKILRHSLSRTKGVMIPYEGNKGASYDPIRFHTIFLLAYRHGLRRGEVTELKLSDVSIERNTIFIRRLKGSESKTYPLQPDVAATLETWIKRRQLFYARDRDPDGYLFPSLRNGGKMSHDTATKALRLVMDELHLDQKFVFHSLRFSIAVHLFQAGFRETEVADWLGHRQLSSTARYITITNPMRDNISRKIGIDEIYFAGIARAKTVKKPREKLNWEDW